MHEPLPHGRAGSGPPILEVEQPHGAEHIAEAAAQKARDAGVEATPHAPRGEVADVLAGAATKLRSDLWSSDLADMAHSREPSWGAFRMRS